MRGRTASLLLRYFDDLHLSKRSGMQAIAHPELISEVGEKAISKITVEIPSTGDRWQGNVYANLRCMLLNFTKRFTSSSRRVDW